jgi:hypothetical protein
MDKFWLVWNPIKRKPTLRHNSFLSAQQEAIRLAKKEGETIWVLEAIVAYEPGEPKVIQLIDAPLAANLSMHGTIRDDLDGIEY